MVNLVKEHNSHERKLTEGLASLLKKSNLKNVEHIYFDFHKETSGEKFHKVNELMDRIYEKMVKFDFFVKERFGRQKILRKQLGVFRTNCIDCLDRTNVTQAKIAMRQAERIVAVLRELNIHPSKSMSPREKDTFGELFGNQIPHA